MARTVNRYCGQGVRNDSTPDPQPANLRAGDVDAYDAKRTRLRDLYSRMLQVYDRVNESFAADFSLGDCEALESSFNEFRNRSINVLSHLPSFEEMQGMNQVAGLWSDLFQTEVAMVSNAFLLERNVTIAKRMKQYFLTREKPRPSHSQLLKAAPALKEIQVAALESPHAEDASVESCVMNVVNQLVVFNERLQASCAEDRTYYNKEANAMFSAREQRQMDRPPAVVKHRDDLLSYLRRVAQVFDTDKCTTNLTMLFFDGYMDRLLERDSLEEALSYNQVLRICMATFLLASALREHWMDISRDSYLERIIQMASGAFTAHDIIATQMDILQTMPRGFTSMYTVTEYGIFYLANVRGSYMPPAVKEATAGGSATCSLSFASRRLDGGRSSDEASRVSQVWSGRRDYSPRKRAETEPSRGSPLQSNGDAHGASKFIGGPRCSRSAGVDQLGRTYTASYDDDGLESGLASEGLGGARALTDYLLLELGFRYMVENGAYLFVYHSLVRWDDLYVARNWNAFLPPSRAAAVLLFHFFVEFFGVDYRKDVIWCRRFCSRAFRMLYDCDVGLWYAVLEESIRKWVDSLKAPSKRYSEMGLLFKVASQKFQAAATCVQTFWARLLFDHVDKGGELEGLGQVDLKAALDAAYQLVSQK